MNKDINYYRAISNSYDCTIQDTEKYEVQNAFLYDFDNNPSCKNVLLNGEQTKVLVYIETDIVTGGQSYKIVRKPNEILNIGDILIIDDETWFVTKVDTNRLISYSGTLAKSVCTLKFFKNGELKELPCYINVGTRNYINEKDNDYLRLPKSLYTAYCPDLDYLDKEDVGIRFVIKDYVYRAVGIDNLTVLDGEVRDGLIIIKLEDDSVSTDDNMELGIANYWSNLPKEPPIDNTENNNIYKLSLDTPQDYISLGETLTISCRVKDTNNNIVDEQCNFIVNDNQGNSINYIKLNQQDNTCTLKATTNGKYIGSEFDLIVTLNNDNSVKLIRHFNMQGIL